MLNPTPLSEYAAAVYDVLVATARPDAAGQLVSNEPLYRFLLDRFGIPDPQSRQVRTRAVRELTEAGLVRRLGVRGRRVEILVADGTGGSASSPGPAQHDGPDYDEYVAAVDRDLDAPSEASRRVEQAFLRKVLLGGRTAAACAFCGRTLPADLLVAAHLRRRADLSRDERLRFRDIAVLACTLGCDAFYELGYLSVDEQGLLLVSSAVHPDLAAHLVALGGRTFANTSSAHRQYLAEHRSTRFRDR
jgi:hypothetical protein